MSKIGQVFYMFADDEYWEICRVTGPKNKEGDYPFEVLVTGFEADDDFIYEVKFEDGLIVDDDNFDGPSTDMAEVFDLIFHYGKPHWILDRWRKLVK